MDTRTGHIYSAEQLKKMQALGDVDNAEVLKHVVQMEVLPTKRQMRRTPPKVGRNERCPCGSGRKFKRCCLTASEGQ